MVNVILEEVPADWVCPVCGIIESKHGEQTKICSLLRFLIILSEAIDNSEIL